MSDEFVPRGIDEQALPHDEAAFAGPNLTEEMALGQAARSLLDSESYQRVTLTMQDRLWQGFRATPVRDIEGLQYLKVFQKVVEDMHQILEDTAETGKMAAIQLTREQEEATQGPATPGAY